MENLKRNYNTKDVDMLISAGTIIESAIADKVFLQSKRSNWADPFFEDIKTQINKAIEQHLGIDNARELREATQTVIAIQKPALKDLAEAKIQIEEDFKSNPTRQQEILTTLGFKASYNGARTKDQEALINLLYQFKTNLTPALTTEITTAGTSQTTLDTIVSYAETLKNANITQEGTKGTRKEITAQALQEFNNIYDKTISISKIASKFYKDNPAKKDQFSFAKVVKNLNFSKNP